VENEAVVEEIPAQNRKQSSWKEIHRQFTAWEFLKFSLDFAVFQRPLSPKTILITVLPNSHKSQNNDQGQDQFSLSGVHSATLTPMHLRKAKLMFFWVRYPSSAVLKMYFPDIKFNKNNTAQLVKWFSNFR
jgi:hypothetical protein